ncbi:aryl-alcohol dehydrogenase [Xylariaceae sp. FL0662B]|nr:aryl-alcohol dehydrogenase [Xylariaceae sp. FL0662B]
MSFASPIATASEFTSQQYDFIICGGGTAGLVLAGRLSENPNITVGVIEAGQYLIGDKLVDTPGTFLQLFHDEKYDWIIKTTPQKGNKGIVQYVRGSKQDYDDWTELLEDPSWSSSELNKYFMKHETMDPIPPETLDRSTFPFVADYHGTSGPIHTSFNEQKTELEDAACGALKEAAGFPPDHMPVDPWSGDHIGFYSTLGTVVRVGADRGKRSYAARGYYEPNKNRPNLKVICNALVHKVLLNEQNDIATGVEFSHEGTTYQVSAKREVLVCGGAVKTPQILELSGIGDPKVLEAAGIACKVENSGVGANFQDHVWSPLVYQLKPGKFSSNDALFEPEKMVAAIKQLEEHQTGPFTSISSLQGFIPFEKLASEAELADAINSIEKTQVQTEFERRQLKQVAAHLRSNISANLQVIFLPATGCEYLQQFCCPLCLGLNGAKFGQSRNFHYHFKPGVPNQRKLFPAPAPGVPNGFTLAIVNQYPASRGTVHVTNSDPTAQPAVNPAYVEHPADKAVLAAGLRFAAEAMKTAVLGPQITGRLHPPPELDVGDLEQGKAAVEDVAVGAYHACGSCAMGSALDSRLRVHGVRNLRVCDASVFPNNVSGNIQGTVYAVAEKGADIIKADHGI